MIDQKIAMLSILKGKTIDCHSDKSADELKALNVEEYSDMFLLLTRDVMNTLYTDDIGEEVDEESVRQAAKNAGISGDELIKRGVSYVNMCLVSNKIDNETATNLITLLSKAEADDKEASQEEKVASVVNINNNLPKKEGEGG